MKIQRTVFATVSLVLLLVVDLFDANTQKLIWRGSSSDTLSDKSDKNIKNSDKDVQKMFDHFVLRPPGKSAPKPSSFRRKST
jgi:hypothetical protein